MFGGILEKIRSFEADIEHHIDNIVQQKLLTDISNRRHQILRDHFILQQAEAIRPIADKLLDLYLDQDEIVAAQEAPSEGESALSAALKEFEAQIADIREYHRTFRDLPPVRSELDHPDPAALEELFTLGERYGAVLDLEPHYHRYSNFMLSTSKRAHEAGDAALDVAWEGRVEYFKFVPNLAKVILSDIDAYRKVYGFSQYREFVEKLLAYLIDFDGRVKVMEKDVLFSSLAKTEADAAEFWSRLLENKESVSKVASGSSQSTEKCVSGLVVPPPLRKYTKAFALWPITHVESISSSSSGHSGKDIVTGSDTPSLDDVRAVVDAEAKIVMLLQTLLFDTLQDTEKALLRDYGKTAEEIEWERAHQTEEFHRSLEEARKRCATTVEGSVAQAAQYDVIATLGAEDDNNDAKEKKGAAEETEGQLLDRDGKPVPRWLVQLQQLHKKFYCEVCGGTVYIGPKAFKEHFGAERHAEGLRRLGVTIHLREYEGISSIRKVIEMRDKVIGTTTCLRKRIHEDLDGEEMQDAQGNVITAGAYRRFQKSRHNV